MLCTHSLHTGPPPLNSLNLGGPLLAGAGPSWHSPYGKGFQGSSELCDGSVQAWEAAWHQSHPFRPHGGGRSSSSRTCQIQEVFCCSGTHSTAGSHLPPKKVASQLEVLHEPALAQQQALGPPLSQQAIHSPIGERGVILSSYYLKIRSRRWCFIHTRSSLVPRLITSWLSSPLFLNVLINPPRHRLLLFFFYATQSQKCKGVECWCLSRTAVPFPSGISGEWPVHTEPWETAYSKGGILPLFFKNLGQGWKSASVALRKGTF